jgi:hypothetical protein
MERVFMEIKKFENPDIGMSAESGRIVLEMEANMSEILDFKKADKSLYSARTDCPAVIKVPRLPFVSLKGLGDPNREEFKEAVGALYGFSYALRMSEKNGDAPSGFYLYSVAPLEGVWSVSNGKGYDPKDKAALAWTIMIRQPDFLDKAGFARFVAKAREKAAKKKENAVCFDKLEFARAEEGVCAQILHRGPYDDEPATFALMEAWLARNGYARITKDHREIYLSAPGKTPPEKMKTLLRVQIMKA